MPKGIVVPGKTFLPLVVPIKGLPSVTFTILTVALATCRNLTPQNKEKTMEQ
jgi:hypothetical protein